MSLTKTKHHYFGKILPYFIFPNSFAIFYQALIETAITRVALPLPIFVLPPIIMAFLEK